MSRRELSINGSVKNQDGIPHGTSSGYTYHACRCQKCRDFMRDYMRERRASRSDINDLALNAARRSAQALLAQRHPREFQKLYEAEIRRRGIEFGQPGRRPS